MITRIDVDPVPSNFHTLTPALTVQNAPAAIEFYKNALGARERYRTTYPDGWNVVHAELEIGDSVFLVSEEFESRSTRSPLSLHGTPVVFHLYVADADQAFRRAVEAGAAVKHPMEDAFWGDRYGSVLDPFGHEWGFLTRQENLSPEERTRRAHAWLAEQARHIVQD